MRAPCELREHTPPLDTRDALFRKSSIHAPPGVHCAGDGVFGRGLVGADGVIDQVGKTVLDGLGRPHEGFGVHQLFDSGAH